MDAKEQGEKLRRAAELVFEVENFRRSLGNSFDKHIAAVCFRARSEIATVEGECLIERGIRERKGSAICGDREIEEPTP